MFNLKKRLGKPEDKFAHLIKNHRSRKGVDRGDIAKKVGVNVDTINRIEHSSVEGIVRHIFEKLIRTLNLRPKDKNNAFNLLNKFCPKKTRNFKHDSKARRMRKIREVKKYKKSFRR